MTKATCLNDPPPEKEEIRMSKISLSEQVKTRLRETPLFFSQIVDAFRDSAAYRELLLAWSDIREENILKRDRQGRCYIETV